MTTQFEKILSRVLPEANFLTIADNRYVPGALLKSEDIDLFTDEIQSFLSPPFQPDDFETELAPANFILAEANESFSDNAALSVLSFLGLSIGRKREFSMKISVEELRVRRYKKSKMGHDAFETALRIFKADNEDRFKSSLRGRFLVFNSFYASKFRLEFSSGSGLESEVKVANPGASVGANLEIEKEAGGVLVSNNIQIPFAVSGFRVTRSGVLLEF